MRRQLLSLHGVKSLKVALGLLHARGISTGDCLKGTGVSENDLASPDARVNLQQELVFYRNILELTGDPLIGLQIGAQYHLPNYGIWGYAVMSAPNLREALTLAFRFICLTYTCHDATLHAGSGNAEMRLIPLRDYEDCTQVITDRDTSALFLIVSELLGRRLPLEQVCLIHRASRYWRQYQSYFGCPIRFGHSCNALHISPAILDDPLPHSDPYTAQLSEHQCEMLLAKLNNRSSVVNDIRQFILARPGHFPSIEDVAEKMGRSPRNLRRLLKEEGRSYSELLNELRYQLAREYLEVTPLTIQEIARMLGYSEPGNFTHAFKRWSGVSPQVYRSEYKGRKRPVRDQPWL